MAQAGVVAYGIYLYAAEHSAEEVEKLITVFTDAQVDFSGIVNPGDRVTTTARKMFFRRKKLRCEMEMKLDDGTVVCSGVLSGMGVPR
jgi:3-hydroxyacyl-[acyl-carrier-protein] dehydratase